MLKTIESFATKGLKVVIETVADTITIALSGSCDSESVPRLPTFFALVHEEARSGGMRRVVVDCEALYFMNSSSVKCFVTWLAKVKDLTPTHRYAVQFRTNKRLSWQTRSLAALQRFAPEVVSINSSD
jgi:anti-anti-sigma factor